MKTKSTLRVRLRKCLRFLASYALFTGPASTESSKYNFKIRSHSTIYTFKNYFATMFLAISGIQTEPICLFGNNLFSWNWKFFVESIVDKTKKVTEIVQWDSWIVTKIIIRPINSSKNKLNRKKKDFLICVKCTLPLKESTPNVLCIVRWPHALFHMRWIWPYT